MLRTVAPLSAIIALRFLGLFIVLPVLSVYALELPGANEWLVGITLGGYALTQMVLQVPFGMLSDKIGRKVTIAIGLVILIIGSLVCAAATDIYMLMFGRFLQGAGAIGAVGAALVSDLVKEEMRSRAMAVMGGSIALSFAFSMGLGPVLGGLYGVGVLFLLTAACGVLAIIVLFTKVPNPPRITHAYELDESDMPKLMNNYALLKMNLTNFLQKGLMTLAFLVIPLMMVGEFGVEKAALWKVYLPALLLGVLAMGASAVYGEKKQQSKAMLILGVVLFGASYLIMGNAQSAWGFIVGVAVFFVGFNIHEPLMQSLASKYARVHQKGTALGVFNSFGHLGTFLGGALGGWLYLHLGLEGISWIVVAVCVAWVGLLFTLTNPHQTKNLYLPFADIALANRPKLAQLEGVVEWYQNETEALLIVKYDAKMVEEARIVELLKP
ncbi:MFS transporter [Sulfurospirillum sp. T05]|uniref:MFS transporter n=1 Tax=Sulfurospirillum tamanense TaxID=2813362 RepID=A0ABS2WTH9_9BACT|nr:MFS transporter [Sulfurospirillum tamanensis]MBN2964969.1 MFS transporter [Sulfurospirillum tamanensis]